MTEQRKVAIITGASNGFGRQTAEAFLREGYRTFATMRGTNGGNATAAAELKALGADVVELDVTSDASVDAAAKTILDAAGRVDVLVNNAGNAYFGVTEAFTPQAAERQFATNVFGPLRVNRAFLPAMRAAKRGLIVYVSSVVGRMIIPFGGVYVASKFALEAFAETMSYELRPFGIDVAIVQPGAYGTNITNTTTHPDDESRLSGYASLDPLLQGLFGGLSQSAEGKSPSEVAETIVRLAHDAPGTRPLRTVVGGTPAVEQMNAALEPLQRSVLEAFGMSSLLHAEPVAN